MDKQKIVFGVDQMATETPKQIKMVYRILMFLSLMWTLAIAPRFPDIPANIQANINSLLVIANSGIYFFCNCFGIKAPDQIKTGPQP